MVEEREVNAEEIATGFQVIEVDGEVTGLRLTWDDEAQEEALAALQWSGWEHL